MANKKHSKIVFGMGVASTLIGLSSTALAGTRGESDLGAPGSLPPPSADRPSAAPEKQGQSTDRKAKNLVYLELLGNGGLYSINYERMLSNDLSARLGFSYFSISASASSSDGSQSSAKASIVTAPALFNYMVGGKNHKLEMGAGATLIYVSASASGGAASASGEGVGVAGTGVAGYRYSPADGGFVFRVGYTPLFGKGGYQSWGGMSFGGTF